MPTNEKALAALEYSFTKLQHYRSELAKLRPEFFLDESRYIQAQKELNDQVVACMKENSDILETLHREPDWHGRHLPNLAAYFAKGGYEESVFVMTKYPGAATTPKEKATAKKLQAVIDAVTDGIRACNHVPRVATDAAYGRWLWDNVELNLLGCRRGIAIVEDRYLAELNPNVAMEWGWMVGMGREVLFLREAHFKHDRADWGGLLHEEFDWDDPTPGVVSALKRFLLR